MGTINYKTSDYITIGYNCNNIDYDEEFYNDFIQDYYDQASERLKDYNFYYFHVKIEPGYYEGFSIDIEYNFPYCFDNYREKQKALKEVTQIKAFLMECINDFECCVVYPGWCTSYLNHKESIRELNAAAREMRGAVKNTCTYSRLPESEKIPLF